MEASWNPTLTVGREDKKAAEAKVFRPRARVGRAKVVRRWKVANVFLRM